MKTGDVRNPGDAEPRELIERTIRVDQAGEFGAVRIYQGQLAALRWTGRANSETGRKIAAMARTETSAGGPLFTINRLDDAVDYFDGESGG